MLLDPGIVLHGRYHVLRPIGRGGMGAVYEAIDLRLQNTIALKQMTAAGSEAAQAFEREAKLLAALRHASLPVVIDYFSDVDSRFLVMQFIDGEDLATVLKRKGPIDERELRLWASAVLEALTYLHSHSPPIVHRDLKPANLKLTPRGDIVVLDFGLAKGRPDLQPQPQSEDRSIYGYTPHYAPPEQLEWRGTDPRSDLYALGATLYHLVTGVPPAAAPDRADAVAAGREDPLFMPLLKAHGVSGSFFKLLTQALELDPADRFQSAAAMLEALRAGDALSSTRPEARPDDPSTETAGARRIDAAMPAQAEVNTLVDLIVQVRFADSPLLGLEDWPSKRLPKGIEQVSEAVTVDYPVDPRTGRKLPARLRVKLVAPDFAIRGTSEHLIDVPPDEYSKRLAFLLVPQRAGFCRVNVEVYAVDTVYLGTVPVETEALALKVEHPVLRVANLMLGLVTRDGAGLENTALGRLSDEIEGGVAPDVAPALPRAQSAPSPPRRARLPRWLLAVAPMFLIATLSVVVWQQTMSAPGSPQTSPTPPAITAPPPDPSPAPVPTPPAGGGVPAPSPPTPTPVPPAPALPPAVGVPPGAPRSDEQQIRDVISAYVSALSSRNIREIEKIYDLDSARRAALVESFKSARTQRVAMVGEPELRIAQRTAVAECVLRYEIQPNQGPFQRRDSGVSFTFRKFDDRWRIVNLTRR